MAAPTGEESIYNAQAKRSETRIGISLDYPGLFAQKVDTFASGSINPKEWHFLALAPEPLLVDEDGVHFRSWGGPAFEILRTTEHWFPDNPSQPFQFGVQFTFPMEDPVYTPMIVIGGIENQFGELNDPVLIMQQGSAMTASTGAGESNEGDIKVYCSTQTSPAMQIPNDQASHFVTVEWDPQRAVNEYQLTIKFDNETIWEEGFDETEFVPRPMYCAAGWVWPVINDKSTGNPVAAPGSIASPVEIMILHGVSNDQLATEGFETPIWPAWTEANTGGTIDTAAVGERFEYLNHTFAKINPERCTLNGSRGRSQLFDTLRVDIYGSSIGVTPNLFSNDRLVGRQLFVDTRTVDVDENLSSAWRRQGYYRVKDVTTSETEEGIWVHLDCRSEVLDKLETFASIAFLGEINDEEIDPNDFPIDISIGELLETMVEISTAIAGSENETLYTIRTMSIVPDIINSGGQSLLPVFAELIDQAGYEYYVTYTPADEGRIRVHAWTLGTQTPIFIFEPANGLLPGMQLHESETDAPNQVSFRQNLPIVNYNEVVNAKQVPTPGLFPVHPYPARGRPLIDSLTIAKSAHAYSTLQLHDRDDNVINGGVAPHRYRALNTARRQLEFTVVGHDWLEPGDEVAIDREGVAIDDETWIVDNLQFEWRGGVFQTTVSTMTSNWLNAIRRSL